MKIGRRAREFGKREKEREKEEAEIGDGYVWAGNMQM